MPLEEFPLLHDNTRLIRHKDTLYKVKVRYEEGTNDSAINNLTTEKAHTQIEDTFRALLYILQRDEIQKLKPIQTENFLITIIQSPWSLSKKYGFSQNGKELEAYPIQFEFRIKVQQDDKQAKGDKNVKSATPARAKSSREMTEKTITKSKTSENAEIDQAEDDSVPLPSFTRSNRGSLLRDGKRVLPKDSGKGPGSPDTNISDGARRDIKKLTEKDSGKIQENLDLKVSDGAKIRGTDTKGDDLTSTTSRGLRKRKPRTREVDHLSESSETSKRSRTGDKGLVVEQYHNRNNSSKGGTPRLSGQRLRKSRETRVGKRHSQRLRTREDRRQKVSSTEISESESEIKGIRQSISSHLKRDKKHDTATESSETEDSEINKVKTENKLRSKVTQAKRRRRGGNNDINGNKETSSETETESESKSEQDKHGHTRKASKDKSKHLKSKDNVNAALIELAQDSKAKTKKHKLYTDTRSPMMLATRRSLDKVEAINSPRVSTVLPQKRTRSSADLQSPRLTRQQNLVRSPVEQVDLIASSRQRVSNHLNNIDDESRRIQRMQRQEPAPTPSYRNILLAQGRDRHMVEQAERAETNKLRQLYEPTAVRRSPRLQGRGEGNDPSLWRKFVGAVFTPFKNMMGGNKRRWSDIQ